MDEILAAEVDRLKKDYFEMEQANYNEKACLLKVVNTFGAIVGKHPEFKKECHSIKHMVNSTKRMSINLIDEEISKLRGKIFSEETKTGLDDNSIEHIDELEELLLGTCRIVKKMMYALLDDFYPMTKELKEKADSIKIECNGDISQIELEESTNDFLSFLKALREKISKDFKNIYSTFTTLLEHVKDLEKTLAKEFGEDIRMKEIEQFEMKVNNEVGSIADSFDINTTIDDIKKSVFGKLKKIRQLVSIKKEEEVKKSQKAQKNINKLKDRIAKAEKDAIKMSKKAKHFKSVATKDGLTGLYNRQAFDISVKNALNELDEEGRTLSLVLFDVNDFKWINDTLGHVAGDKVLKKVAQCLKETFRKNDFIARYGGDEFAVVIEGMDETMARKRISTFENNFKKKRFFSKNTGKINVTLSAGTSTAIRGESPENLIHRADMDMYEMKKNKS